MIESRQYTFWLTEPILREAYTLSNRQFMVKATRDPLTRLLRWSALVLLCLGLVAYVQVTNQGSPPAPVLILFFALCGALLAKNLLQHRVQRLWLRTVGAAVGERTLTVTESGLTQTSPWGTGSFPWSSLETPVPQPGWIAIAIHPLGQIIAIPDSVFAPGEREAFLAEVSQAVAANRADPAQEARAPASNPGAQGMKAPGEAPAAPPAGRTSLFRQGWMFLTQLPRALAFQPPQAGTLVLTAPRLLTLGVLQLGLAMAQGALQWGIGSPQDWAWWEFIRPYGVWPLVFLGSAAIVLVAGCRERMGEVITTTLLVYLPLPLLGWASFLVMSEDGADPLWQSSQGWLRSISEAALILVVLWFSCALSRLCHRLLLPAQGQASGRRRTLATLIGWVLALLLGIHQFSSPYNAIWLGSGQAAAEEDGGAQELTLDEDILYGQEALLSNTLDAVEPGKRGKPEIFFLGFAGYGEQNVFLKEVRMVEQLFLERFGTTGHSVVLANNAASARDLPMATAYSLEAALARIGEKMNRDEDTLFLFLTSHGSRDHRFSLAFSPFSFTDITPEMLKEALDHSGITRRVVVVSACYSGGFIPTLADPETLVITASAADRNSFGCAAGNEMTDFGRAYFNEALRQTTSFTEAFSLAARTVDQRETEKGLTHSLPQMQGGEKLFPRETSTLSQGPAPASPGRSKIPRPQPAQGRAG